MIIIHEAITCSTVGYFPNFIKLNAMIVPHPNKLPIPVNNVKGLIAKKFRRNP